jgi:hypothetical protein
MSTGVTQADAEFSAELERDVAVLTAELLAKLEQDLADTEAEFASMPIPDIDLGID